MKLLFVISSLSAGGAERVLTTLANHFSQSCEVVIVTISDEPPFYPLSDEVRLIQLGLMRESKHIFDTTGNTLRRIRELVEVLRNEDPDVVISFMTQTNFLAVIASKISGYKIIISERITFDYWKSPKLNGLRRLIYPFSDALVTQTYGDKDNYKYLKNIHVIYNPLSNGFSKNVFKKEKLVLGAGRLDKQKGFDKLIRAFHGTGRSDWKLVIAGEGNERENLEKLIENLGASNIELIGRTKAIFDWYARASIFVLSSSREGFPNVLLEAMSMDCAVVSFDCPYGPGEIIEDGINGILVENQNEEKLREALERLIEAPELRNKLGEEAKKVREKYSIEKISGEWEQLIRRVAESESHGGER
ncbi:glycosyltransferase family 4 protein [Nitratifractor sp.]|uniref:glycosyltransferase family 4 protein n=1 Tax=Nitratifractor sp. TaxID=2268144 RepID=UPI0025CE5C31|nr:glycosyltransferase family 4 protein [Nitratifractor sp.]